MAPICRDTDSLQSEYGSNGRHRIFAGRARIKKNPISAVKPLSIKGKQTFLMYARYYLRI
jgi:hypothetical protein